MTPYSTIVDTSNALYSDGDWYLLDRAVWAEKFVHYKYPHRSVVYHACRNPWKKLNKSMPWALSVQYRVEIEELATPCGSCHEVCPEALQSLWKLHNFDSIQSTAL